MVRARVGPKIVAPKLVWPYYSMLCAEKRVIITEHLRVRAQERGFTESEILYALGNYATRSPGGDGSLKVFSRGLLRPLQVVVLETEYEIKVLTVMPWRVNL